MKNKVKMHKKAPTRLKIRIKGLKFPVFLIIMNAKRQTTKPANVEEESRKVKKHDRTMAKASKATLKNKVSL